MNRLDELFWVNDQGQRCFCNDTDQGGLSRLDALRRLLSEPDQRRSDAAVRGIRLSHLFELALGPWRGQPAIRHQLVRQ